MAARLALGAAGELVGELEALVARAPAAGAAVGVLVTALYRAGRQSDALAAYAPGARLLADELGARPRPRAASGRAAGAARTTRRSTAAAGRRGPAQRRLR